MIQIKRNFNGEISKPTIRVGAEKMTISSYQLVIMEKLYEYQEAGEPLLAPQGDPAASRTINSLWKKGLVQKPKNKEGEQLCMLTDKGVQFLKAAQERFHAHDS